MKYRYHSAERAQNQKAIKSIEDAIESIKIKRTARKVDKAKQNNFRMSKI
jgi:hypothetical protein